MRSSGIVLHPSSLAGRGPIGTLGAEARAWVDVLQKAGQSWWQILPLGPTGYGDSPYMSTSSLAGNPLLIDPWELVAEGLVDVGSIPTASVGTTIDWVAARAWNEAFLAPAWERLRAAKADLQGGSCERVRAGFDAWVQAQRHWLHDFALFTALLNRFEGALWTTWPAALRDRHDDALRQMHTELADAMGRIQFEQFVFDRQWRAIRTYANERHIGLIGDIPIFVSWNSADVWCNPGLFLLNDSGTPMVVAGVPPDYFSPTGQRWGNPLYRWPAHAEQGYSWWIRRFEATFQWVDCVRVDHFRGFEAYWEIQTSAETAVDGHWVQGPGRDVFDHVNRALGHVDIIAEDLGIITPQVEALRDSLGYPGMKVLHFGLGDDTTSPHAPHNVQPRCVVYTGTHDNNTTVGWYTESTEHERHRIRVALGSPGQDISWEVMRAAWQTVAERAVAPAQDVLRLGADCRMNTPGVAEGNWAWRMLNGAFTAGHANDLRSLTAEAGRLQQH